MEHFRFAILGAGEIAVKFSEAAAMVDGCRVCAVASKSLDRAKAFAEKNGIEKYYGDYEELLDKERPDCAYIAVTPNDHFRLSMMCVKRGIPVLCEKAMFLNSDEAGRAFEEAGKKQVFMMEAMWTRFLPAIHRVRSWLEEGRIGTPKLARFTIGFNAPKDDTNKYFNPALKGGASKHITVYAYELITYILNQEPKRITASAVWTDKGVDITDHITMEFEHTLADILTTFDVNVDENMVLYGEKGKILIPYPHFASECFLYDEKGDLAEHFTDQQTVNGFTYEIEEVIKCVNAGNAESCTVPWSATRGCAALFDKIDSCAPGGRVFCQ